MQACLVRFVLIHAGLVTFALLGCGRPSAPPRPVRPFEGRSVRIQSPAGTGRLILDRVAGAWARQHGVTLTFADDRPDVIAFEPADLGRLVAEDRIAPLPESVPASGLWASLARPYRAALLRWGDTAYALPVHADATLLFIRADVLQGGAVPSSFEELAALAERVTSDKKSPALTPMTDDDDRDREFFTVAAAFAVTPVTDTDGKSKKAAAGSLADKLGFHFDATTGRPRIAGPGFVAALRWLQKVQRLRGTVTFREGTPPLGFGTLRDLATLRNRNESDRYVVAAPPPGPAGERIPYFGPGGLIGAVARNASEPEAALALLKQLGDAETSLEVIHGTAFASAPFRPSHLSDRSEGWFNYGLDAAGTDRLRAALAAVTEPRVINAPLRLRVRFQDKYRSILLDGVREALESSADARKTLENVAAQWEAVDRRPEAERLAEYLRSLNLSR